jgi:chorismate mutase
MDKIRSQIQQIDEKMIKLIAERMKLAQELGLKKKELGLPVRDDKREKILFEVWEEIAKKENLNPRLIDELWSIILDESIRIQSI